MQWESTGDLTEDSDTTAWSGPTNPENGTLPIDLSGSPDTLARSSTFESMTASAASQFDLGGLAFEWPILSTAGTWPSGDPFQHAPSEHSLSRASTVPIPPISSRGRDVKHLRKNPINKTRTRFHQTVMRPNSSNIGKSSSRLACPYFKQNPQRYRFAGACSGPGFLTSNRLKEHLFRKHSLPQYYCNRCFAVFATLPDQSIHLDSEFCIQKPPEEAPEGLDKDQERRLRSRRNTFRESTEEDKWIEIFQILFPNVKDDNIPNPYFENRSFQEVGTESQNDSKGRNTAEVLKALETQRSSLRREIGDILESKDVSTSLTDRIMEAVHRSDSGAVRSLEAVSGDDDTDMGVERSESDSVMSMTPVQPVTQVGLPRPDSDFARNNPGLHGDAQMPQTYVTNSVSLVDTEFNQFIGGAYPDNSGNLASGYVL
ncbi:hypothetical protein BX600DRAFT_515798 [Xylariales sp. PMI_506]|nr:hypothetical protein BX600DRAFT_515798 [Xylariales sp. PMI_506]